MLREIESLTENYTSMWDSCIHAWYIHELINSTICCFEVIGQVITQ